MKKNRLRTIGLLIDWITNSYQIALVNGIMDCAREYDVNFLCFKGAGIRSSYEYEVQRNIIYTKATRHTVDGLIISSGSLGHFVDSDTMSSFCNNYKDIPLVSIDLELVGVPSVMCDNEIGMFQLMDHLINDHAYRKMAFITGPMGNYDARRRYDIFVEKMNEYKITIDQDLIINGDFTFDSGVEAAHMILDKVKKSFEVIICSNDDIAMGVMHELHQRGIQVPNDIAVVGFDDMELGRYSQTPLTTVQHHVYKQAWRSAEILIEILNGKDVPFKTVLPTELKIRESCGCFPQKIIELSRYEYSDEYLHDCDQKKVLDIIIENIKKEIHVANSTNPLLQAVKVFLNELYKQIDGNKDQSPILQKWRFVIDQILKVEDNVYKIHKVLTVIRNALLSYFSGSPVSFIEDVFYMASAMNYTKYINKEKSQFFQDQKENRELLFLSDNLAIMDTKQLVAILDHNFPSIGLQNWYIVLYENQSEGGSAQPILLAAHNETGLIELDKNNQHFSPLLLFPQDLYPKDQAFAMIVEPIYYTTFQLGYFVFDLLKDRIHIYDTLRRSLSSTLRGISLFDEVANQKNNLKQQSDYLNDTVNKLRKAMAGFIKTMNATIEVRDPYTASHQHRVSDLARTIAHEMKLDSNVIESIRMSAIIHDLGKIYVPAEILNKPGKLKDIEFNMIKTHPTIAYDILKSIEFPWPIADIIVQHHERLDGSGYPYGLKGDEILLEAKILSVADVVEAITSHRPYRPALGLDMALDEISKNKGIYYDPDVVDVCIKLFTEKDYTF